MLNLDHIDLTISGLQAHYRNGDFTPAQLFAALNAKADSLRDNPIWITRLSEAQIAQYLAYIDSQGQADLPLYGVPFAIKDNIDLAAIPTTAACKAFEFTPNDNATVVAQLIAAGAIPMGKTNMDQFATGLVGVRSPWGACRNALNSDIISGGSSSGSAVAVALGLASFSLGTDTAGSGRVPASLNNLVGLKPSRGLLSCHGVVPACKSLDCVSIFALNVDDANQVLDVAAAHDRNDPFSRKAHFANGPRYYRAETQRRKIGVPDKASLEFFGSSEAEYLFNHFVANTLSIDHDVVEVDFTPFLQAAKLLYEGPWVAERYLATQPLIDDNPEALLPVINTIIGGGKHPRAADAFAAQYRLQALKAAADAVLAKVDAVITPTNPRAYTIAEVEADPIALNSQMGYYTNFMNLLDYAALAIPAGFFDNGVGFGVTLFHHAQRDKDLLSIAAQLQNMLVIPPGCGHSTFKVQGQTTSLPPATWVNIVVCGAHLDGLPLNWQLRERDAEFVERTTTSDNYRLFALPGGPPARPALLRDADANTAIEVEVWRLPADAVGTFIAEIPAPLGVGKVELADGRWLSGFICDNWGLDGAEEISTLGGWRAYIANAG
ncbi:allophanate hydrolase [Teredinibacter turnerae]|uniref:allophanate hydrolase n=1 Tax=Teredinibacter turnerae TaxID=2426 RepID=UPI0003679BA9|nr:allophanate hydrolase [Teredinibacter turnerae]